MVLSKILVLDSLIKYLEKNKLIKDYILNYLIYKIQLLLAEINLNIIYKQ